MPMRGKGKYLGSNRCNHLRGNLDTIDTIGVLLGRNDPVRFMLGMNRKVILQVSYLETFEKRVDAA